jgi:NitT/TauT family transport system ATP-binding protein
MSNPSKIRVTGARKSFAHRSGETVEAIRQLTFDVEEGDFLVIVGETGAGKSVFFDCLMGLKPLTGGRIEIDGLDAMAYRAERSGRIARVFQEDRLLPWRTAAENVAIGLEIQGVEKSSRMATARRWLDAVGLHGYADSYPGELSGGMRQRVNIARAFALSPDILLMDEAFSALDEITASRLRSDFLALARENRLTYLIITHSIDEAITLGSRILVFGAPAQVVRDIRVSPDMKEDPVAWKTLRDSIVAWLGKERKSRYGAAAAAGAGAP